MISDPVIVSALLLAIVQTQSTPAATSPSISAPRAEAAQAPASAAKHPVPVRSRSELAPPRPKLRVPAAVRPVSRANRKATREPSVAGFINAVQIYPWSDGALYRVFAAPERVTDIALQSGETLIAVASGDTARWTIGDTSSGSGENKRTHILIKPYSAGLATNLVVTTDRRSYHLELTSTAATAMAAVSWTYPAEALLALRREVAAEEATKPIAAGLALETLRFDYRISGDAPEWRPLRAFDDGRQTYLEFPASLAQGEAPPLFLVGPDGTAELVNYRVAGRFYVIDRLFDAAELRLGGKKQQIVRIARDQGTKAKGGRRD